MTKSVGDQITKMGVKLYPFYGLCVHLPLLASGAM